MEREFRAEWMRVPVRFWGAVWVGWRIRIAWVVRRRAEMLRRGCAEKSISGWRKVEAQIVAVSFVNWSVDSLACSFGEGRRTIQMPAWAIMAVPDFDSSHVSIGRV